MTTMKEAIVSAGPKVEIVDSQIPEPGPEQVVIKVVVSGSNPKDWKMPEWMNKSLNSGDDIAGYVHAVGSKVWEFRKGDRVASFHEMLTPHGSFAEYALGWQHTTFHIPESTSFEEAATLPLAAMTSALGLHQNLGFDAPWVKGSRNGEKPLVVYGGASAVGAFVIKLAQKANIHPIIAVAGHGIPYVEGLIDKTKGDAIVDYRKGHDAVVQGIRDALKGKKLNHAYDAVSDKGSYANILKVLEKDGHITFVLPGKEYEGIPETVKQTVTQVWDAHGEDKDFAYIFYRYMARGLAEGWFSPHPVEVVEGGLAGVEKGMKNLKEGNASAVKYVFRIPDTPGVKA